MERELQEDVSTLIAKYESWLSGTAIVRAIRKALGQESGRLYAAGNYTRSDIYMNAALALHKVLRSRS